ncbi:hypothetical protein R1sor_023578 [Riccia sorocarpa]|uniref:Uncharacterized protein n=1 Tax=Riccia sorocarpa TaxID=122646 RepID=A0ABD3GQ61_9MARC
MIQIKPIREFQQFHLDVELPHDMMWGGQYDHCGPFRAGTAQREVARRCAEMLKSPRFEFVGGCFLHVSKKEDQRRIYRESARTASEIVFGELPEVSPLTKKPKCEEIQNPVMRSVTAHGRTISDSIRPTSGTNPVLMVTDEIIHLNSDDEDERTVKCSYSVQGASSANSGPQFSCSPKTESKDPGSSRLDRMEELILRWLQAEERRHELVSKCLLPRSLLMWMKANGFKAVNDFGCPFYKLGRNP